MIGEERKMESRSQVDIEVPTFKRELEVSGTRTLKGDVEAYSSKNNLAVIKLDDIEQYDKLSLLRASSPKSLEDVFITGIGNRYSAPIIQKSYIIAKDIRERGRVFNLVRGNYLHRIVGSVILDEEGNFLGIVDRDEVAVPDTSTEESEELEITNLAIKLEDIKNWLKGEYLDYLYDESVGMQDRKEEREQYKEKELMRRLQRAGLAEEE